MRALIEAATAGDESAFAELTERHRRELRVHCYRMLGSLEDSEDVVQETFLRAWRSRESFSPQAQSSFRAWLYRIATNACLDVLKKTPRRLLASQLGQPGAKPGAPPEPPRPDIPWLEPYPDHLLAPAAEQPEEVIATRETIEIAFLAAIQLLAPRERAALILRDVLGWSAKDAAAILDTSTAAVNSGLQRARAILKQQLPRRRDDWAAGDPTEQERAVLQRFMDAFERSDTQAVAALLREDAYANMPPYPMWHDGRETIIAGITMAFDPASPYFLGDWRVVPAAANLQPAAAFYVRRPGDSDYRAFALDVLTIEAGQITSITAFYADVFPAFGLAATL
jgi:RNA polymerase sigma-70 factor (ECF subfamily)